MSENQPSLVERLQQQFDEERRETPVQPAETAAEEDVDEAGNTTVENEDNESESVPEEDDADDVDDTPDVESDQKIQPNLERIQRKAQEFSAWMAEEKQALEQQRQELAAQAEQAKSLTEARERAHIDPVAFMRALGFEESGFEELAKEFYAASPEGQKDDKVREASVRRRRSLAVDDELSRMRKETAQIKQEMQVMRHQAEAEKLLRAAGDAVDDSMPVLASQLAKTPNKLLQYLEEVAIVIFHETGELPQPSEVAQAAERRRRAELEDLGVDVDKVFRVHSRQESKTPGKAVEKKSARTLSNPGSPTPTEQGPQSFEERKQLAIERLKKRQLAD